ncbi:restriction endonuclease subunit S [Legionella saoudiensis]|uniref:restriction endonuclease subunit S n=1 Tax=Legionella saoudiensis TaxID=1750561 RepID=UPI0007313107|nr:restriction endonuclease subunit S [Legionella saoudiensis]
MEKLTYPANWSSATLEELLIYVLGGDWGKDNTFNDPNYIDVLCIRASELRNWDKERGETATLRKVKKSSLERRELREGDIILEISGGGPDQPVGRTALIDRAVLSKKTEYKKICTNFFRLIRPSIEINSTYLNLYLQSFYKSGKISEYQAGSNNLRNLKFNDYTQIEIPIAPLNEQKRIVAKIEELFSELDNGIAALKTAREQLKVYRQAILKHAFEGKLTAKWREENADKLETSEQLLSRIQKERDTRYQHQLEKWKAAVKEWEARGKEGKKPGKTKQSSCPISLSNDEVENLPQVPLGFTYTYLANIGDLSRGKSKHRPRNDSRLFGGKYPFIQTGEVKAANRKITNFEQTYSEFGLEQSKLWPIGTLCITIAANIAETAFLGFDGCFPDSVVGFTAYNSVLPEYVELFIKAIRIRIEAYAPATAQKNINLTTLENLVIPYCSTEEQKQIVDELELQFSIIDKNETEIEQALKLVETLRQSILKKAFSGKLVPQNPNDESASKLLARIKAEKDPQKKSVKKLATKQDLIKVSNEAYN